jgi:Ser/Thr protein kinase RdoA (MazF antagonist)
LSLPTDCIEEHPLAHQFNHLTPDQVLGAVESGGRTCTGRFIILNSFENRVYQLELSDGNVVIGKFYRPGRWSREAIQAEHDFLTELQEEEIPVACPLEIVDGQSTGLVNGIFYALFPRIGGRSPQEPSNEQIGILGRHLARIHNVGTRNKAKERSKLTPQSYGLGNLDYLLENQLIPKEAQDIYAATVLALVERITPLFHEVPTHRIHGDCHLNNLLWSPTGPTFLDFDDFLEGPAVQDIWLLAPSADTEGCIQRDMLIEAYGQMREFNPAWLRLVEPLRALRYIRYSTWIARRWADPAFKQTFSHFGTLQYWQTEIQDLREQIARIDHASF